MMDETGVQMALDVADVVDGGIDRDKALGGSRRSEALHLAFVSPDRLVGDFGPIVLAQPMFVIGTQAERRRRNAMGYQLVGGDTFGREPVLFEPLAHRPFGSNRFASTLDQKVEDLAIIVDRSPQIRALAADVHRHLVEKPARTRLGRRRHKLLAIPGTYLTTWRRMASQIASGQCSARRSSTSR